MRRAILATGAAASAAACASFDAPSLEMPVTAPEQWASPTAPAAAARGDWLAAFADARLTALVREALDANYDIAAAAARLDQARHAARIAGADRWPSVNGTLDARRTELAEPGELTTFDPQTNQLITVSRGAVTETYGLGLTASWEFDLWRRLAASAQAGVLDAVAAEADLADAQLSIAASTAIAWFDLVQAQLLSALADDEVATQNRALTLTERRFEAGIATSLDVRLARSAAASSEANRALRRQQLNSAVRALEVLLGRYPAAELDATSRLPQLPRLSGTGAPGELLTRRPDLRAAEARLEAAGLRARAARRALFPRLSLTASYGTDGVSEFSDVTNPDALVSNLVANLTAPIFNAGALGAEARRNADIARAQLATYANAALNAYREAEDALDAERFLEAQERALAVAVAEAEAAEALAEREYTRGVGTIFELLDAQNRRLSAQGQLIAVRRNRVVNRVTLHVAIGGDFRSGLIDNSSAAGNATARTTPAPAAVGADRE